jgi:hypothetical protein
VRLNYAADKLIVIASVAILVFALGRAALGAGTFPYAMWNIYERAIAENSPIKLRPLTEAAWQRVRRNEHFTDWWGGRRIPWLSGDDYVAALANRPLDLTLGPILGALVSREREKGVGFSAVIMPDDPLELVGTDVAAVFEKADGTTVVKYLSHPATSFERASEVPVIRKPYNALLDDAQLVELKRRARLVKKSEGIYFAVPPAGASGTWVLVSQVAVASKTGRQFYLVPEELSPVRGGQ